MAELKALLIALIKGQGSFEEASLRLDALLRASPDEASDCRRLLEAARDAGLPADAYAALDGQVTTITENGFPETVVLERAAASSADDGYVETVVLQAPPAMPDPDMTTLAADDPDTTVFASPEADATVLGPPDADATEIAATDRDGATSEATVMPGGGTGAARHTVKQPGARVAHDDHPTIGGEHLEEETEIGAATGGDPDATEFNRAGNEAPTIVGGSHDDATAINAPLVPGTEVTAVNVGVARGRILLDTGDIEDSTTLNPGAGNDDLDGPDATAMAMATTGRSEPGAGTRRPGTATTEGAGITREFRENDKLRGRFELISMLGEGGMGAVWKGRDLLKVEARDRNPFVAIKLLQGDFKEHPEAFIALQRETSKQQRLAHPNIATVYDFDRDDETQTVFMTMEVLEGQPLDSFIRKLPADGLPEEEAMPLIHQLCAGLAYAHGHDLVHSDLKPGNCFLTREGSVKLLDFGIARASKTKSDAEGDATLFDPGQLGALTPTYATLEMFDGQDPDPRDDIYALAIMTYQLLTGKHPYGKKSAPKALELGLEPAPVDKLNKQQNRGLARGLAFHREDRTPSVEAFLDDLERKKSRAPVFAGAGLAATALIAALSVGPVTDYVNARERDEIAAACPQGGIAGINACLDRARAWEEPEQRDLLLSDPRLRGAIISHIARGDEQSINEALDAISSFDPRWQQDVREEPPARDAILDLYQVRIAELFAPEADRYDYTGARALVGELDELFPDSARILNIENGLEAEQQAELSELGDRYNEYLAAGRLVSTPDEDDIGDVLAVIRRLDPEHRLLADDRLRFRFSELAEAAIEAHDYEQADALLAASVAYTPDDPALSELRFEVETELTRLANEQQVREVEERLRAVRASLQSLEDFESVRGDLLVLAELSPQNPVLIELRAGLENAFSGEIGARIGGADFPGGERLIGQFAKLLEIPYLTAQRSALSSAERDAGFELAATPEREAAVEQRRQAVQALLAAPDFTGDWERRLEVSYKELIAFLAAGDERLEPIRDATANVYLERARVAREAGRFGEALALIRKGQVFYPGLDLFDAERQRVADAREALRLQRAEEARLARTRGLEEDFRAKANDDQVQEAKALLGLLERERLDADDTFVVSEAPGLLADAYTRLAEAQARSDNFPDALTLAKAGLALAPRREPLVELTASYEAEVSRRQRELALRKRFDSTESLDAARTRRDLDALRSEFPDRYAGLAREFGAARSRQLVALANARSLSIPTLGARLDEYEAIFPESGADVRAQVVAVIEKRLLAAPTDSARQVDALAAPLAAFGALAPGRDATVSASLATRSAGRIEALSKKSRSDAYRLLVAARTAFGGGHVALDALSGIRPPPPEVLAAAAAIDAGKLSAAREQLERARSEDARHPGIADVDARLGAAESRAREQYAAYASAVKASKSTREQKRLDGQYKSITRLWSDNPELKRLAVKKPQKGECTSALAGFGSRRGGSCYDLIGKRKGPEMVVVPAGGRISSPYAIGKFEVTVDDYNLYCKETKACTARSSKERRLPVTGISIAEAERYAAWLSERASKRAQAPVTYRLPTVAEWEHAASGAGSQPEKKFNCRVTSGGSIIAGHALIDARSGKPNAWGVTNYVGNAQEWVRSGNGVVARGGAFEDSLADCEPSISRNHGGEADALTGFRLVRDLG